jgi:hypothetical protein
MPDDVKRPLKVFPSTRSGWVSATAPHRGIHSRMSLVREPPHYLKQCELQPSLEAENLPKDAVRLHFVPAITEGQAHPGRETQPRPVKKHPSPVGARGAEQRRYLRLGS